MPIAHPNSLTLGCDCLGTIQYFDGVLNDHKGEPSVIKNAVCIHEEDAGTLWKHTEYRTGKVALARSRRLVISFIVTVVNYEYALYWYLYTDATIAFEIKATGELSTNLLEQGATPSGYGTTVAPQINGQYHQLVTTNSLENFSTQHMFSMRLDPMIDGVKNTVSQVDVVPLEGDVGSNTNPYGQGFTLREIPLKTTHTEQGQANSLSGRIWKISNPSSLHPFTGQPVAWKLVPMNTPPLMAKPGSIIHRRAGFAKRSLWVTPYHDEQMFAAGFYVNQSYGGAGLDEWTKEKKNVEDEDVVIWHTFGVTQ
ncbi:copper amine oxidase [Jimgerdemannia flammicorona]|uniref:Amine oxidase n=1 Tax=Jimgerdemannia flammicorona TaxID=994334 RepID=A0A433PDY7_9FUNG|nr:copper amine oxidase [Jimgerdemannia flammicorona]